MPEPTAAFNRLLQLPLSASQLSNALCLCVCISVSVSTCLLACLHVRVAARVRWRRALTTNTATSSTSTSSRMELASSFPSRRRGRRTAPRRPSTGGRGYLCVFFSGAGSAGSAAGVDADTADGIGGVGGAGRAGDVRDAGMRSLVPVVLPREATSTCVLFELACG